MAAVSRRDFLCMCPISLVFSVCAHFHAGGCLLRRDGQAAGAAVVRGGSVQGSVEGPVSWSHGQVRAVALAVRAHLNEGPEAEAVAEAIDRLVERTGR